MESTLWVNTTRTAASCPHCTGSQACTRSGQGGALRFFACSDDDDDVVRVRQDGQRAAFGDQPEAVVGRVHNVTTVAWLTTVRTPETLSYEAFAEPPTVPAHPGPEKSISMLSMV